MSTDSAPSGRHSGPGPWIDEPFATLIREWRKESGLTQVQMAQSLGIQQSEVSLWERGWVQAPRYGRMESIAHHMQIPLQDLLAKTRWVGPFREPSDQRQIADLVAVSQDPLADLIEETRHMSPAQIATLVRIARILSNP